MVYSYAWGGVLHPGKAVDFFPEGNAEPFSVDAPGFSRANAWWLSELSRLIYMRDDNDSDLEYQTAIRNTHLHRKGLEERWFYNGRYVQCAIVGSLPGQGKPFSVLVFRGTQGNIGNWLVNLNTARASWPAGGEVHRGFMLILSEVWQDIRERLDIVTGPLYYTGHSLGGALAVLAASLKLPTAVYTFGSPRIGNADFVLATKHIPIFRVVNPRDIVAGFPGVPGILHVGEPHYLSSPTAEEAQRCWFEAPGFLADHSPANYSVLL